MPRQCLFIKLSSRVESVRLWGKNRLTFITFSQRELAVCAGAQHSLRYSPAAEQGNYGKSPIHLPRGWMEKMCCECIVLILRSFVCVCSVYMCTFSCVSVCLSVLMDTHVEVHLWKARV